MTSNFNDDGDSYSLDSGESSHYSDNSDDSSSSSDSEQPLVVVDSDQQQQQQGPPPLFARAPSSAGVAVRRRMPPNNNNITGGGSRSLSEGEECESSEKDHRKRKGHRRTNGHHHSHQQHQQHGGKKKQSCKTLLKFCREHHSTFIKYWPTCFLALCFMFWMIVQTGNIYGSIQESTHRGPPPTAAAGSIGTKKKDFLRQPKPRSSSTAMNFFSDAVEGLYDLVGMPGKLFHQASRGEALPPGCVRAPWQALNLPNCNDIHETNLLQVFTSKSKETGFVGSGYWRHVWLVANRGGQSDASRTVLKMMKEEHKVETRNFERHRRDALAMERTTASPYIVDIYAYCGNSVLTEYVGSDLHKVLYSQTTKTNRNRHNKISDKPPKEKLRLAWEVAKSVADLHGVPGGPIVQADITAKQFLVDNEGHVKLNDFNRCRFMGHDKDTKEKCTFRIPSAPGRNRSPEEYADEELTEQLDTYSTANVLYGILTGYPPWDDLPLSQVKRAAKYGSKPPIDEEYRNDPADALLASLIERAYEHDPEKRIRASEIVDEIDNFLGVGTH